MWVTIFWQQRSCLNENLMGINIIVFGDSLSLPMPYGKEPYNNYSQVWTGILNRFEGIDSVVNLARPASTSSDLLNWAKIYSPCIDHFDNLIIIFIGIVDASPRAYPKILSPFLNRVIKILRFLEISWNPKISPLLLKIWGKPWVSSKKFAQNTRKTHELFPNSNILFIGLNKPGQSLIRKIGEIDVFSYNLALQGLTSAKVHYLEVSAEQSPDGHHLSASGQIQFASKVYEWIRSTYYQ
jgi:lysophospholipase L1-like esterase